MQTYLGPDFFSANRQRLRGLVSSTEPIVITGNGSMQRGADEPSSFHQDSNFWYLTGLNGAGLTLVMLGQDAYIMVPTLSTSRQAFDGTHDVAAYSARSGITDFVSEQEGWQRLRLAIESAQTVATLASPPPYIQAAGLHTLPYRRRLQARLKRMVPGALIHDIRPELTSLRALKQPEELQALQAAIDTTSQTLRDIAEPKILGTIKHEFEIEAQLSYGFRFRGSSGHAFSPIVGAGGHATTLHYLANDGPVAQDDLIVVDVGAEVEHYAADISRTISKQPITGRRADVFRAVESVQDYALGLLKPGVLLRDYEQAVEQYMGDQLIQLGLIANNNHAAVRHYFPHATSHYLGLDTHDTGDYSQPLQAGMVVTCEPGIYIPEDQIGVRIEDDVLITGTGNQVLSAACPRRLTPVQ